MCLNRAVFRWWAGHWMIMPCAYCSAVGFGHLLGRHSQHAWVSCVTFSLWSWRGFLALVAKTCNIHLQVMHRETMAYINELTGANCITKGHFYDTTKGEAPGPGDERKIFLLIEGATPQQVGTCSEALTASMLPSGGSAAHNCLAQIGAQAALLQRNSLSRFGAYAP